MPTIPLTLRTIKGSKLTFNELDSNFLALRNAINTATSSDTFVTGGTYNPSTTSLDFVGNSDFNPFSVNVSGLLDTFVSGGTYNPTTGCATFVTNSGTTFEVCGFLTGATGTAEVVWTGGSAGNNSVTQITDTTTDATADYAVAINRNTLASGFASFAGGRNAVAAGSYSIAYGVGASATTTSSHAFGQTTLASGGGSFAIGTSTVASDTNTFAMGSQTTASGGNSYAGGGESITTGSNSLIHSSQSLLTGDRSVLLGGQGLTGVTDDTVYVPFLNINNINTGTSINNLGVDSSGNVVVGTTGAPSFTGNTSGTCINELWVSSISGCSPVNFGTEVVTNGQITANNDIKLPDNSQIMLGDSSDFRIYHDGINTRVGESGTGNLLISGTEIWLSDSTTGKSFLKTYSSQGKAELLWSGSPRLYTSANGIVIQNEDLLVEDGNVGVGTLSPSSRLEVLGLTDNSSGDTLVLKGSGGTTNMVVQDGGYVGIGTSSPTKTLDVVGETRLSGSGQNILTIIGSGSGSTTPLFTVQGSSGELFSITDNLVGSLFTVNDISGLPILEVFDNDTVLMGNFQAPSLNTTVKLNPGTGLSTVYSLPMTSGYTGGFFDYTVSNTGGARSGNIMSIFSGTSVEFTETSTNDIGSTTDIIFTMSSDGSNASLQVSAATTGWEVKTIVRSI
jgi:hypothetical protein